MALPREVAPGHRSDRARAGQSRYRENENSLAFGSPRKLVREPGYVLAPIYSWFTEGFDTADLREAKRLLEQLSRA